MWLIWNNYLLLIEILFNKIISNTFYFKIVLSAKTFLTNFLDACKSWNWNVVSKPKFRSFNRESFDQLLNVSLEDNCYF